MHAYEAVWKENGTIDSSRKADKAFWGTLKIAGGSTTTSRVAIVHCKGHRKGETDPKWGNRLADQAAKGVAEQSHAEIYALIPKCKEQYDNDIYSILRKI